MYCPNCTTAISTDHKYCRSCGVDLREISQALGGPRHTDRSAAVEAAKPRRAVRPDTKLWRVGFFFGVFGLMFVWENPEIGSLLMLVAICLMVTSYFVRDSSPKTTQRATRVTGPAPAKLPVPSITERTTKLFEGQHSTGSRTGSHSDV